MIVLNPTPVVPGCVIRSRPIGVLMMVDEAGGDEKILAVPVDKLNPYYTEIASYRQLPAILIEQIEHFFTRYKDLEKGKSVTVKGWGDAGEAGRPDRGRDEGPSGQAGQEGRQRRLIQATSADVSKASS